VTIVEQATYVLTRCLPMLRAVLSHTYTTLGRLRRHPTKSSLSYLPTDSDGDDHSNLEIVAEELWLQKTLDLVVPTKGNKFVEQLGVCLRSCLQLEIYNKYHLKPRTDLSTTRKAWVVNKR